MWAFPLYLCTWVHWSILHELLPIRQLLIQLTSCGHNWQDAWVCSLSGSITWCESVANGIFPQSSSNLCEFTPGLLATTAMLWSGETLAFWDTYSYPSSDWEGCGHSASFLVPVRSLVCTVWVTARAAWLWAIRLNANRRYSNTRDSRLTADNGYATARYSWLKEEACYRQCVASTRFVRARTC